MVEHEQEMYIKLHQEYFDKLVMWCICYVNNDPDLRHHAEDWVQEAFYRAIKDRRKFIPHPNKYGWFVCTCKHIADNAMQRKGVRNRRTAFHIDAPDAPSVADTLSRLDAWLDKEESDDIIVRVLSTLTPMQHEIFQEVIVAEEKAEVVANRKGKPLSAIKGIIRKIRKKARKIRDMNQMNYFFLLVVSFHFLCS